MANYTNITLYDVELKTAVKLFTHFFPDRKCMELTYGFWGVKTLELPTSNYLIYCHDDYVTLKREGHKAITIKRNDFREMIVR